MGNASTLQAGFRPLYASDVTGTSLSSLPLSFGQNRPSGDGYFGEDIKNNIGLALFGTGSDNTTVLGRVNGVRPVTYPESTATTKTIWIRLPLFTFTATLSTYVGGSVFPLNANYRMADSIVVTSNANVVLSPTSAIAEGFQTLQFDALGYTNIQIELARGTAAAVNGFGWTY